MSADIDAPRITVHRDGLLATVELSDTDDGPLLKLSGQNCALEGIAPGEYLMRPAPIPSEAMCECGHTAHWHNLLQFGGDSEGVMGAGACEHDGECACQRFHAVE